jgi:hypothetical protein
MRVSYPMGLMAFIPNPLLTWLATAVYGRPGGAVGTKMRFGAGVEVPVGRVAVATGGVWAAGEGDAASVTLLGEGTAVAATAAGVGAAGTATTRLPAVGTAVGARAVGGTNGPSVAVGEGEDGLAGEPVLTGSPTSEGGWAGVVGLALAVRDAEAVAVKRAVDGDAGDGLPPSSRAGRSTMRAPSSAQTTMITSSGFVRRRRCQNGIAPALRRTAGALRAARIAGNCRREGVGAVVRAS